MGRSGYTGLGGDGGLPRHLLNDTSARKAVSRISTFFSSAKSSHLARLVELKGKEKKNPLRAKKLGFPFSR